MKKFIFSSLLFAFTVLSMQAQWTDDPLINTIVSDADGAQAVPHVAYDADGNFYIGFYSNTSGNYDIWLQYYTFDGVAQWTDNGILISNHTQNSWVTDWDLTTDNSGNCVMAFNDVRDGNANVYAYSISPTGEFNWGDDGIALTSYPEDEFAPSITVTTTNDIIVAWSRPTSSENEIIMQKITQAGDLSWGDDGITYQAGSQSYTGPRVLGVENGNYLMAFYKETGSFPSITRNIYVQKFDGTGSTVWTSDVLASAANGINAYNNFYIASDNADGIVISWMDDRDNDMNIDGGVQRVLSDGTIDWPDDGVEVNTTALTSNQDVRILGVDNSGNVLVTWSKKNANQSQTAIAGQKINSSGVRQWTDDGIDFIAMSADVYSSDGGVVYDGTNALIIYEEHVSGSSVYSNVSALAVDGSGSFVWTPNTTLMASRSTEKSHLVTTGIYDDMVIAVWEEATTDIYMQNIYNDGTMGDPPISDDATLSDLTVNEVTVEGFSPDIYNYSVAIPDGDPLPVTGATANHPNAIVDITQTASVPGTSTTLVTAEDGITQLTYTIDFYVASTDATLSDLTVDGETIEGFDPNIFEYDYEVATGDPIPVVGATANDPNATVDITQTVSLPGTAEVLVTAEDGTTTNLYTVNFLYTPNDDATLLTLTVNDEMIAGFDPLIFDYTNGVVVGDPIPYVDGVTNDVLATVVITQADDVPGDATLVVTAEDGVTVNTYTVSFFYFGNDATLSDLTVDGVTIPNFDPNITDYQYFVENPDIISVVDGVTNDPEAFLTVTQATEIPGDATLYVLAEDSITEMTYTVHFYTSGSDATLMDLTVDGNTIEGFEPGTIYYEYNVNEGSNIPVIDGTTTDPLASKEVTQATEIPGDATILVTAEDGTTQITYTVHFNLIIGINYENEVGLSLYPNPVAGKLSISGLEKEASILIFDLTGKLVGTGSVQPTTMLNVEYLEKGIYVAVVNYNSNKTVKIKFVKD